MEFFKNLDSLRSICDFHIVLGLADSVEDTGSLGRQVLLGRSRVQNELKKGEEQSEDESVVGLLLSKSLDDVENSVLEVNSFSLSIWKVSNPKYLQSATMQN